MKTVSHGSIGRCRVGSGRVRRFPNLAGGAGSCQEILKYNGSGRVGSGQCSDHGQRETLYPWRGLLIKSVLVGTHVVVRLEMEE